MVVGGAYGCVKLYARLTRPAERWVGAHRNDGDDRVGAFAHMLASDVDLRGLATAAGIVRVQTPHASLDLRTCSFDGYGFGWPGMQLRMLHAPSRALAFDRELPPASAGVQGPSPATLAAFHFVLRGEHARGDAIVAGRTARLHFDYGLPPADAVATARGDKLDEARERGTEIHLAATARGAISVRGASLQPARFDDGRLASPVVFELEAGAAPGPAGVHIGHYARGELIHETEIALRVVASLGTVA